MLIQPLTSLQNSYARTRIHQDPRAPASSARTRFSSWACPHTRSNRGRLSYKIRSTSVPPTPALGSPGRPGKTRQDVEAAVWPAISEIEWG